MAPLMPQYVQIMESFVEKYLKILPDHLRNDGIRIAHNYFPGFFNRYAEYLREKGVLVSPGKDSVCDVIISLK